MEFQGSQVDWDASAVAIGGGHGLASTLSALVKCGVHPVGIVSVADDGGSSGRLREDYGVTPPGDIRKCLLALSGCEESVWRSAFDYRFSRGGLQGHSLGNLILAGLTEVAGNFSDAIHLAGELLEIKGKLYPSSVHPLTLAADAGGVRVEGQVRVMNTKGIDGVYVLPGDPELPSGVADELARADVIVAGPGSLYTSVLAVLCIPKIKAAIRSSKAKKIYVANLRPQIAETDGFDLSDHISALLDHGFIPDVVLADHRRMHLGSAVELCQEIKAELAIGELSDSSGGLHDPVLLAEAIRKYGL